MTAQGRAVAMDPPFGAAVRAGAAWAMAPRAVLAFAARRSVSLPLWAMGFGLLMPPAAAAGFAVLPWITASMVFCALMGMEAGATGWRPALRMLPALGLGAAGVAWAAGLLVGASAEEAAWMALFAAAPVSGVAVANTAALGWPARPAALVFLASTLSAPLVLPLVAWLVAGGTAISPGAVAQRAAVLVLLPAGLAFALRRLPVCGEAGAVGRREWKGFSALSLTALALARMDGLGPLVAADPWGAGWAAGLGVLAAGAGVAVAVLVPWPAGWRGAALVGGCKSGALVWAIVASELPPAGQVFMALTVLPTFGLPSLVAASRRWRSGP